ncbi:MAG: hypothetical protein ABI333_19925 [bacterium]
MKRIGLLILPLLLVLPPAVRAAEPEDALEGTVTKKVSSTKKVPLQGFSLRLGYRLSTGLNFEPDNASLDMSYQFKLGWAIGARFAPKSWLKHFTASLRLNLSHQPAGSNPYYRTGNTDPSYRLAMSDEVPIGDTGYFLSQGGVAAVPRTVDGNPRTARVSDLMLTFQHGELYKIPKVGIAFDGLIRFMFPTSVSSRNATMFFAMTFALGASRTFKFKAGKVKQSLMLGYTFGFSKYFHEYKTGKVVPIEQDFTLEGATIEETLANVGISRNPDYAFSNDFFITYGIYKGVSLTLSYGLLSYRTYKFDCDPIQYNINDPGAFDDICANNRELNPSITDTGWRDMHGFSATLSYQPLPYLGFMLMLATQAPQRMPNSSSIQQPFLVTNRNGYSSLMLTMYLTLDKLYTSLTGKKKKKTVVERKDEKNTKDSRKKDHG